MISAKLPCVAQVGIQIMISAELPGVAYGIKKFVNLSNSLYVTSGVPGPLTPALRRPLPFLFKHYPPLSCLKQPPTLYSVFKHSLSALLLFLSDITNVNLLN